MKKITVILAVLLINVVVLAQEKLTEGVLISKATMTSDNPQANAQFESMGNIRTITYIKNGKSKGELSNPVTGDIITISDEKEMLVLMDSPFAGKVYQIQSLNLTEEELEDINLVKGTETKTILGYTCEQYKATINQGDIKMEMELFTTDKIPNAASQQTAVLGQKLKGYPLSMTIKMNQLGINMIVTNEVTEIKKESVSDDKFDMTIPEGYSKLPGQ